MRKKKNCVYFKQQKGTLPRNKNLMAKNQTDGRTDGWTERQINTHKQNVKLKKKYKKINVLK